MEILPGGSVFRDNKTERMRTMRTFNEIMGVGNADLKGLIMEKLPDSPIVTAKKKLYVPERKLILMDQLTEQGSRRFMGGNRDQGGWIV